VSLGSRPLELEAKDGSVVVAAVGGNGANQKLDLAEETADGLLNNEISFVVEECISI
jgi:hypothetical protein